MCDSLRARLALPMALALLLIACACGAVTGFEAYAAEGEDAKGAPAAEERALADEGQGNGETAEGETATSEGEAAGGEAAGAAEAGAAEGEGADSDADSEGEGEAPADAENAEGTDAEDAKPKGVVAQWIEDALEYASEVAADAKSSETYELEDLAELEADNIVDPTQRADNSFIYDSTIATIVEQSSLYNGKTVQVIGEAVGDRIKDTQNPGYCWVTLAAPEEGSTASVFALLSDELANQIDHYGRYGVTGTMLQVRGTFNQACAEHDGQTDLHATEASVISRGVEHPDEFDLVSFYPGIISIVVGLILFWAFNFARERTR